MRAQAAIMALCAALLPSCTCTERPAVAVDVVLDAPAGGYRCVAWGDGGPVTLLLQPGTTRVMLPAGRCEAVAHAVGCAVTFVTGHAYGDAAATTSPADGAMQALWTEVSRRAGLAPMDLRQAPDMMYGAAATADAGDGAVLALAAGPLCVERTVTLASVEGLCHVARAEAFVTGCAAARRLCDGAAQGVCAVPAKVYRHGGTLVAAWSCLGDAAAERRLALLVTDTGGRTFVASYDLAGGAAVLPSGLAFDDPPVPEGGPLPPSLQDWDDAVTAVHVPL